MDYRLMQRLLGSAAVLAPETDDGAEFDDLIDDGGQDDDPGDDDDDQDDDVDDPEGEQDDDVDDPPARREPSRGQRRFQALTAERDRERQERERLQRELEDARRGPAISPEQMQAERERRLAAMTPEARADFLLREQNQQLNQRLNQVEFNAWDSADLTRFEAMCASNPAASRLKDEVETALKEYRRQGQNVSRETVLKFLIGEKALARQPKAKTRGQRTEAEGRNREGARPANGRGDATRDGNRSTGTKQALRKRLEGVKI